MCIFIFNIIFGALNGIFKKKKFNYLFIYLFLILATLVLYKSGDEI